MRTRDEIWREADPTTRRLAGLALNPSTPEDALLRLLSDAPLAARMVLCMDRDLPWAVMDAVITHPDTRTRSFFARNPYADPAQRARLVDDPEWLVRAILADGPLTTDDTVPRRLPDDTVLHMINTYDNESLGGSLYRQISPELWEALPTHPDPKARVWGAGRFGSLSPETRAALLADPDDGVREQARRCAQREDVAWVESQFPERPCHTRTGTLVNHPLSRALIDGVLTAPAGPKERVALALNPTLPPDVVILLAADPDPEVRERIAHRADLGPDQLRALAVDPDPQVRFCVSLHPAWSEEERAAIDYEVPMDRTFGFYPEPFCPRDPEDVRRDALSGHPMLRRRAAQEHSLPPDLPARLTEDDDLGVRVILAQNHPDASAKLLLRSFLEYTGCGRARLPARPNFPTHGLARYADDEDPEVRALAARDPGTSPETVERLTRDADPAVRAAFARHPNLPSARLTELLDDEELVHHAAANPALGVDTIRRLVAPLPVS